MIGVQAALAAQRGYKAEENILETHRGFFRGLWRTDGASVVRELAILGHHHRHGIKLAPGGHPSHALAEAAAMRPEKQISCRSGREHHGVSSGFHGAHRATAPDRSDRHGAIAPPTSSLRGSRS